MLENQRVLVTVATGQVARSIAEGLAKNDDVWAGARFSDASARAELEVQGIRSAFIPLAKRTSITCRAIQAHGKQY